MLFLFYIKGSLSFFLLSFFCDGPEYSTARRLCQLEILGILGVPGKRLPKIGCQGARGAFLPNPPAQAIGSRAFSQYT